MSGSVEHYRIEGKRFVCGLDVGREGVVVHAAPIIKYMEGWGMARVRRYCEFKGWTIELLDIRVRARS